MPAPDFLTRNIFCNRIHSAVRQSDGRMRLAAEIHPAHEKLKYGIADYRRVDDKSELITTEFFFCRLKTKICG